MTAYTAALAQSSEPITLAIESLDDAWSWFEAATKGLPIPELSALTFENWPVLAFKIDGRDWHSSVPTRIMGPLLDYHRDLQRAYANIRYGTPAAQRLKDEERDQLELVVGVAEGSSEFLADLAKQFGSFAGEAIKKMSAQQVVIVVLGLGLLFTAPEIYKEYISERQSQTEALKTVQLSQQETERLRIMSAAVAKSPQLEEARIDQRETENRILKSVKPQDRITVAGVTLNGGETALITRPAQASAERLSVSGIFRILRTDTDRPSGVRIKVESILDGQQITADVPIELPAAQKDLIAHAEWHLRPIALTIDAERYRDQIRHASVVSVQAVPNSLAGDGDEMSSREVPE